MRLEIVAPSEARVCMLGFRRRGVHYGPYRVSLGGPTRMNKWKVSPGGARYLEGLSSCAGPGA